MNRKDDLAATPPVAPGRGPDQTPDRDELAERLARARVSAPAGFRDWVLASRSNSRRNRFAEWWQRRIAERWAWAPPALAGALGALLVLLAVGLWRYYTAPRGVVVHFQIHAPGARQVELLGDFNRWTPGTILLRGPDASGHWTAEVELPEGRYEYQFLVDGSVWVADPEASEHRPDGFGRENAVLRVMRGGI